MAAKQKEERASERELLSNTWKCIVQEDTHADKARGFIGKGCLGRTKQSKGIQNYSATWFTVSGFMVMGLVSGLSLANHSDSGSFLVALLNQDGFQREESQEVSRTYRLHPYLLLTFPIFFQLVVAF